MSNDTDIVEALREAHEAARGCTFDLVPADGPIARLTLFMHERGEEILAALASRQTDEPEAGLVEAWKAIEAKADDYKADHAPAFIMGMNHAAGIVRALKEPKP